MQSLDVGCGNNPCGDVNTDLYIGKTIHRNNAELKPVKNFVKADAHHLPFRKNCFKKVFCSYLLEHRGIRYIEVIQEVFRVGNQVMFVVPIVLCKSISHIAHDKAFSRRVFTQILKNYQVKITPIRKWHNLRILHTPHNLLARLIHHSKFLQGKIVNPLHFFPCPFITALKIEAKSLG